MSIKIDHDVSKCRRITIINEDFMDSWARGEVEEIPSKPGDIM